MWRGKRRWSSTEVLLSVLCLTLLAVLCVFVPVDQCGLGGTESVFSGRLVITRGAVFTEKLRNRSSLQFKSLAFDTEHLISDAYGRGSLNNDFKACEVLEFSNGSVVVNFDLQFRQSVEVKEAEQQLVAGLQSTGSLVVNQNSIQVRVKEDLTTYQPTSSTKLTTTPHLSTTSSLGKCPPYHMACGDGTTCVATMQFCDGVDNCPDGSDENHTLCATKCDGQFLLLGPTGSFHSENFPLPYNNGMICHWVIRVQKGLAIKMNFHSFDTEEEIDTLSLYEGTGQGKNLTYLLSGRSPGTVWLLSDKATVEFSSDDYNNFQGFNATYSAEDISNLSNEERLSCSFEEGLCFWRQEPEDEGDWIRTNTPTFPPFTGPNFDHTFGNQSGYYIVTPGSPGQWEKNFKIRSLRLAHSKEPMCLKFWYHMYGENVHRLRVLVERRSTSLVREASVIVVFQKEGNYGDNWNFGQVTLSSTVVFEAQKKGGMKNDIALDDISLTNGPCGADPPDPTVVPTPTTPPPIPSDCGGPFDLWEPNSTFSSPNYPHSYGNKASCLWTLHAREGWNILLHFLDFDVESTYDMVEVRDGAGPQSELLVVIEYADEVYCDVISTANQITVLFFTDSTGYGRGFRANFTSGLALGMPKPCVTGQYRCQSGECISNVSVCNGQPDCADSSDEADCVDSTSVRHLQLQVQTTRYTTCGQHWNSQLSHFMCRYLACGVRMVSQKMDRSGSTELRREEKGEEESEESRTVRVVGGTDSRKGAWPWMVSLYFRGRHVCGATLIDNEWLVTAAHCVYGKNIHLSNWEAVLGLHSQDSVDVLPSQTRKVDHIIMNKHYNRRTKDADIAMMHLQTNVNFTDNIQPICLPGSGQQFEAGMKCFITGWGAEVEQGTSANVLQQAVLPLVSRSECQKLLPEYNITARMVCAGYSEGGVDSCQGDSGGPLMCEEDGHWVQVGVISFGVGCGRPQRPGVYALVSQFTDWVVQTRRLS
uniref:Enteropeptidase n=1 Tax=Oncorhynchus tshawytscha TaxID=74940 RepID=A0A8C8D0F1_ONCTS